MTALLSPSIRHPRHFVRNVTVQGVVGPPEQGQLVNATKLELGEPFSEGQARQSVENLLEILRSNGFYLAKVTPGDHSRRRCSRWISLQRRYRQSREVSANRLSKALRTNPWKRSSARHAGSVCSVSWLEGLDGNAHATGHRPYPPHLSEEGIPDGAGDPRPDGIQAGRESSSYPVLTIDSGPKVIVRAKGAKISRGKLRDLVPIYQEQTVDKDLLVEGKRELTEYLQSKGYFEAQVDFDHEQDAAAGGN